MITPSVRLREVTSNCARAYISHFLLLPKLITNIRILLKTFYSKYWLSSLASTTRVLNGQSLQSRSFFAPTLSSACPHLLIILVRLNVHNPNIFTKSAFHNLITHRSWDYSLNTFLKMYAGINVYYKTTSCLHFEII